MSAPTYVLPPEVDCVKCPSCSTHAGVCGDEEAADAVDRALVCGACGHYWVGTVEESTQAQKAGKAGRARLEAEEAAEKWKQQAADERRKYEALMAGRWK